MKRSPSFPDPPGRTTADARWTDDPRSAQGRLLRPLQEPPTVDDRQRIWAGLADRLDGRPARRRRFRPAWSLGAGALALSVLVWLVGRGGAPGPDAGGAVARSGGRRSEPPAIGLPLHVRHREGTVLLAEGERSAAGELREGSEVRTARDGRLVVTWSGGALALDPESRAKLTGPSGPGVSLAAGTVHVSLRKRPPGQPYVVQAGAHQVVVTGTIFSVRSGADHVVVAVHRGSVEVRGPSGRTSISGGQRFDSRTGAVATGDASDLRAGVELIRRHAGEDQDAHATQAQEQEEARAVEPAQEPAQAQARAHVPRARPKPRAASAKERKVAFVPSGARGGARPAAPARLRPAAASGPDRAGPPPSAPPAPAPVTGAPPAAPRDLPALPIAAPTPAAPTPGAPAPTRSAPAPGVARASRPNPDVEYERALAMAGSDPRAAVKTLDRLAELGGAQAEPARLRAARLAARYDAAESARRLEAFLAQHGHGPFAHDARLDLVEQRLRGGLGAAEGAVAAFLARHPDSARAPEMLVVRGEIARAVHRRCEAALADYERALPSSRAAEGALRGKALCLRDLGDQAGARAAAEAYLRRHPAGRHASELRAMIASLPRTSP